MTEKPLAAMDTGEIIGPVLPATGETGLDRAARRRGLIGRRAHLEVDEGGEFLVDLDDLVPDFEDKKRHLFFTIE